MARRLRVTHVRGAIHYCRDAAILKLVKEAGGFSKFPPEERDAMRKTVSAGGFCDDLPEELRPSLLAKGWVEWVDVGGAAEAGSGAGSEVASSASGGADTDDVSESESEDDGR